MPKSSFFISSLEALDLKKKKNRLIEAVVNNKVNVVKTLLDSPEMYKVTDRKGNNLLQLAIMEETNFEVFTHLLSIPNFPLELKNRKGHTALETAVAKLTYYDSKTSKISEYFAEELIAKGADIHRPLLLHCAIKLDFEAVSKHLIKNGAKLEEKDRNGFTPLGLCFFYFENVEVILMLLCYGADPFTTDGDGYTPFDAALLPFNLFDDIRRPQFNIVLENLFFYTFDKFGKYQMAFDSYIFARESESPFPLFNQIIGPEYIDQVTIYCNKEARACLKSLLQLGADDVMFFIKRYPEVLREILMTYGEYDFFERFCIECSGVEDPFFKCCVWWEDISYEIFDRLIESEVKSEAIDFIASLDSAELILNLYKDRLPEAQMTELICYFLSYGLNLHTIDLEWIYKRYGYCELFKICLHMDLKRHPDYWVDDPMTSLITVMYSDIEDYIENPSECSVRELKILLNHCAHPKLQEYCRELDDPELNEKLERLPQVPLLVELARNAFRRHFICELDIRSAKQFFNLLKALPVGNVYKKIIAFETKLYH